MNFCSGRFPLIRAVLPIGAYDSLAIVLAFVFLAIPIVVDAASPEATAMEFVHHIQRGSLEKAKRLLESSGYRYRHQGGDDIYFGYESGYDPNFAFLVGRPFVIGAPSARQQRSDWYLLDGTIYAEVALPLRFEAYRPWVLPAPIAFGRGMDFISFMNFVSAPASNPERLTLRIRPSIEPGLIKPPTPQFVAPPPPGPPGARSIAPQVGGFGSYGSLFGSRPVDPAPVVLPSSEALTAAQMGRLLPTLGGITLHLSLIRWGRFSSWSVVRWNFANAVLITEKGEVVMGVGSGVARERQ
jgi:hypothetical protein